MAFMHSGQHRRPRSEPRERVSKRITQAKAERLVAAMEAIRACDDVTDDLIRAFDDARAAISPFYDN